MDPDVKTITRVASSGWMLIGLGFLLVGLLLLLIALLTAQPGRTEIGESASIVGGAFVFLGVIFMCVRSGVILDRQQRTITTWRGLLVPFYKTERPLSQSHFSQSHYVTLSREERTASKREIYVVFPVRLEGPGSDAITIHEPEDCDKARHLAEEIAKFLGLGIRDRSSGEEVAREAGTLDESLRDRLRRAGRSVPLPPQPPGARAILSYGGIRSPTTIEIPPWPVGDCVRWFLMGMLVAGVIAIVVELFAWLRLDVAFGVPTLCVFLLTLCILPPYLIRAAILRERLVVSPDELVVTRRDIFGTKTTRLAGAEVEEVAIQAGYLTGSSGGTSHVVRVVIRSDRGSIALVAALSNPEEVRWLRDVLVHVLTVTFE